MTIQEMYEELKTQTLEDILSLGYSCEEQLYDDCTTAPPEIDYTTQQ